MAINKNKVFSTLNDLIETLKDGEKGFKTAANVVNDDDLRALFHQYSRQRTWFIVELENIIENNGGDISGSAGSTVSRKWKDIKSGLYAEDVEAVLNVAEKGEEFAIKNFSEALQEDLPPDIKSIVQSQYKGLKTVHDSVKRLRDLRKNFEIGRQH